MIIPGVFALLESIKGDLVLEPVLDVETSDFYTVPRETKSIYSHSLYLRRSAHDVFCYPMVKDKLLKELQVLIFLLKQ